MTHENYLHFTYYLLSQVLQNSDRRTETTSDNSLLLDAAKLYEALETSE
jgi:hypothetical protein